MRHSFRKSMDKWYFFHKTKENLPWKKHERFMDDLLSNCTILKNVIYGAIWG